MIQRGLGFQSHRDFGTVDCKYCGAKGVPKTNPSQVTCGKNACKAKRGNERRMVNFKKEKERKERV